RLLFRSPRALRALDVSGLGDAVRALSAFQGDGGVRAPDGRWLARTSAAAATERFGGPLVLLARATLIAHLAATLPPDAVRTAAAARIRDPRSEERRVGNGCTCRRAPQPLQQDTRRAEAQPECRE